MDARALPRELLDEHELQERYKSIDAAACKVRSDIERQLQKRGFRAIPGKLADRSIRAAPRGA